jgi:outer membrane protein TolC
LAFGTEGAVRKSAHSAQAAEFEATAARKGITAGLNSAYQRLANVRKNLSLAKDALERARSVRSGITVERTLGQRSIFDVLNAHKAFAEAQIQILRLRYDLTVAEHLLAAQLGRLDDIYGVTLR